MAESPDPRFLGGESAVLTDTSEMALVVTVTHDGVVDVQAQVHRDVVAATLRYLADHFEGTPDGPGAPEVSGG